MNNTTFLLTEEQKALLEVLSPKLTVNYKTKKLDSGFDPTQGVDLYTYFIKFTTKAGNSVKTIFVEFEADFYEVEILVNDSIDSFKSNAKGDPEIMPNVLYVFLDFVKKMKPEKISIDPYKKDKEKEKEFVRANLYIKIFEKYLNEYRIETNGNEIVLIKKGGLLESKKIFLVNESIEHSLKSRMLNEEMVRAYVDPEDSMLFVNGHDFDDFDEDSPFNFDDVYNKSFQLAKDNNIGITRDKDLKYVMFDDQTYEVAAALFISLDGDIFSFDIVVNKANRNKGLGKELTEIALSEYNELESYHDGLKLEVDVVNPIMKKILDAKGFKAKKIGQDRWIMTKK